MSDLGFGYGNPDALIALANQGVDIRALLSLIMDPQFAALTGTLAPSQMGGGEFVEEPFDPLYGSITNSYLNDPNPAVADAVYQFQEGALSPSGLRAAFVAGGYTDDAARAATDEIKSDWQNYLEERRDWENRQADRAAQASQGDMFANGMMSSPLDEYTPDNVPLSDDLRQQLSKLSARRAELERLGEDFSGEAPRVERGIAGRRGSPSVRDAKDPASKRTRTKEDAPKSPDSSKTFWEDEWIPRKMWDKVWDWSKRQAADAEAKPNDTKNETYSIVDPNWLKNKAAYEKNLSDLSWDENVADLRKKATAAGWASGGGSPYNDQFMQRLVMAATLFGKG